MEMEKALEKAKEKIAEELCNFAKKDVLTPEEVKLMGEFMDMAKDYSTIEGMDTYAEYLDDDMDEMSRDSRPIHKMPKTLHTGISQRRGRSPSTGRFVSRDSGSSYDRGYDDGYRDASHDSRMRSGHSIKDRMVDSLERMYDAASTDHERQVVDKWINKMRSEEV